MSTVRVCREHNLGEQECRQLAEKLLAKLVNKFGGNFAEAGEHYQYKHSLGVTALVEAQEESLLVDVKLGLMARRFAPQLEQEMNKVLDDYLTT